MQCVLRHCLHMFEHEKKIGLDSDDMGFGKRKMNRNKFAHKQYAETRTTIAAGMGNCDVDTTYSGQRHCSRKLLWMY